MYQLTSKTRDMRTHHRVSICVKVHPRRDYAHNSTQRRLRVSEILVSPLTLNCFICAPIQTSSMMINPLLILPLLNASTPTTAANGCYAQNPSGRPQRISTSFIICSQAINNIATGRSLDRPLVFGRSVKEGHKVPDEFVQRGHYSTCVIKINMQEGQQDTLTWRDVIISASNLRDDCVAVAPFLGGEAKAGPRQLLKVMIYGMDNNELS